MTSDPATHVSRPEAVRHSIEALIRLEQMRPGYRLGTKEEVRKRFRVAVATFNEALRVLESRDVIELRPGPGGGIFVAHPPALVRLGHKMLELGGESVTTVDSLAVRAALEWPVLAEAVEHHSRGDIKDLRRLVKQLERCTDATAYLRANWELHHRIAEISHNLILRQIYLGLLEFAQENLIGVRELDQSAIRLGIDIHAELVESIAAADLKRAKVAIQKHATRTGQASVA